MPSIEISEVNVYEHRLSHKKRALIVGDEDPEAKIAAIRRTQKEWDAAYRRPSHITVEWLPSPSQYERLV